MFKFLKRSLLASLTVFLSITVTKAQPGVDMLATLKTGGVSLVFRVTDANQGGEIVLAHSRDFSQCNEQRLLSLQGKKDAKAIGKAFKQHKIKIASLETSAYCRTLDQASISFPDQDVIISSDLNSICEEHPDIMLSNTFALFQKVKTPVPAEQINIILTHQCNIRFALRNEITEVCDRPGRLSSGEAAVVSAHEGMFKLLGCVSLAQWYEWGQ